jgi:hypothetical protein
MTDMEKSLQRMMERLLARQEEEAGQRAENQEEMKVCQDKADAEVKTRQEELKEDIKVTWKPFWKD